MSGIGILAKGGRRKGAKFQQLFSVVFISFKRLVQIVKMAGSGEHRRACIMLSRTEGQN